MNLSINFAGTKSENALWNFYESIENEYFNNWVGEVGSISNKIIGLSLNRVAILLIESEKEPGILKRRKENDKLYGYYGSEKLKTMRSMVESININEFSPSILNTAKNLAAGDWVKFSGRVYFASMDLDLNNGEVNPYIVLKINSITKLDPSVK